MPTERHYCREAGFEHVSRYISGRIFRFFVRKYIGAGFGHVSRYISGLLLSENKTWQGIAAQQIYLEGEAGSRRALHAAVFEAGWDSEQLMHQQRAIVNEQHQGRGREIISLDWTLSPTQRAATFMA